MAYIANQNQQKDDDKQQSFGQPIQIGPSAAPSGPGMPTAPQSTSAAPTVQNGPTSSGRFTNIQNYLNANQNFGGERGFAGKITDNLQDKSQQEQQQIGGAQQQWTQQAQAQDIVPQSANQYVSSALADPTKFAQNQGNVQQFQQYLNAQNQYVAPQAFDSSRQLAGQVGQYGELAGLTQSEPGRKALLERLYNTPYYSAGQQSLDNLILQAGTGQLGELNKVQDYNAQLQNAYQAAQGQTGALGQQIGKNRADVQAQTQGALGGAITGLNQRVQDAITKQIEDRNRAFEGTKAQLGMGHVSASDAQRFGLGQVPLYSGIDPSRYLQAATNTPTAQNVITPEQQQIMDAYATLSGGALTGEPTSVLSQLAGNKAAGTFDTTPYTYDVNALNRDIGARESALRGDISSYLSSLTPESLVFNFNKDLRDVYLRNNNMSQVAPTPQAALSALRDQIAYINNPASRDYFTNKLEFGQNNNISYNPSTGNYDMNYNAYPTGLDKAQQDFANLQSLLSRYGVDPNSGLTNYLQIDPNSNNSPVRAF